MKRVDRLWDIVLNRLGTGEIIRKRYKDKRRVVDPDYLFCSSLERSGISNIEHVKRLYDSAKSFVGSGKSEKEFEEKCACLDVMRKWRQRKENTDRMEANKLEIERMEKHVYSELITITKELHEAAHCLKQQSDECAAVLERTQYLTRSLSYLFDKESDDARKALEWKQKREERLKNAGKK